MPKPVFSNLQLSTDALWLYFAVFIQTRNHDGFRVNAGGKLRLSKFFA
jgi:hypothetical protein